MAGYNQSDFAFTLGDWQPTLSAMTQHLQEKADLRAKEALAEKDKQQQRSNMLAKYVGDQFDNKDFMTGSAADPLISQRLADTKQKYADIIRKNPNVDYADLQFQMSKDIGDLNGYSSVIKNINAGIDAGTKEFDKSKGVDGDAIKKIALYNALYKVDPTTGKATMRTNVNDFDPNHDYVGDAIKEHPDKFLNPKEVVDNYVKTATPYTRNHPFKTTYGGRTVDKSLDAKLYPWQRIKRDAKGGIILDQGGNAQEELRTVPAQINGKQLGFDVMAPDIYSDFVSNKAQDALLNHDLLEFNKANGRSLQPGTPEGELWKSHLLTKRLDVTNHPALNIDTKNIVNEQSWLQKEQAGYTPASVAAATAKEFLKAQKEQDALNNTDPGAWGRVLGGHELEGLDTKVMDDGNTYYDVSPKLNGFATGRVGDQKIYANNIWVSPVAKKSIVETTDAKGNAITEDVPLSKWRGYIKQRAGINGVNISKTDKIVDQHVSKEGQYIGKQDMQAIAGMQAQKDAENFKQNKIVLDKVNSFEGTGSTTDLQDLIDTELKSGTIKNIGERNWLQQKARMDQYYIEIDKGGKIQKQTFESKDLLAKYIKDHLK